MKRHAFTLHQRVKHLGHTVAGTARHAAIFVDKALGHAHSFVTQIDPDTVENVAGREYADGVRHARRALTGYENAREVIAGPRRRRY